MAPRVPRLTRHGPGDLAPTRNKKRCSRGTAAGCCRACRTGLACLGSARVRRLRVGADHRPPARSEQRGHRRGDETTSRQWRIDSSMIGGSRSSSRGDGDGERTYAQIRWMRRGRTDGGTDRQAKSRLYRGIRDCGCACVRTASALGWVGVAGLGLRLLAWLGPRRWHCCWSSCYLPSMLNFSTLVACLANQTKKTFHIPMQHFFFSNHGDK